MKYINISSGHWINKSLGQNGGASYKFNDGKVFNEVNEARKVIASLKEYVNTKAGYEALRVFNDNVSRSQRENLNRITSWHNKNDNSNVLYNVSVHFNASAFTVSTVGSEVLHFSTNSKSRQLAVDFSKIISSSLKIQNRGDKARNDLAFTRGNFKNSILFEIAFVTSRGDYNNYNSHYNTLIKNIGDKMLNDLGVKVSVSSHKENKEYSLEDVDTKKYLTSVNQIIIKKDVYAYNDKDLKSKKEKVKKDTVLTVDKIFNASKTVSRIKLKSGLYITANKTYVAKYK